MGMATATTQVRFKLRNFENESLDYAFGLTRGLGSKAHISLVSNRLLRNALPEDVFKYFSKDTARSFAKKLK